MHSETKIASGVSAETATGSGLSLAVCEALRTEAFAGLKALPRRGAEVGGLLTQEAGQGASPSLIDGFEFFASEHLYGPSFRLSQPEIAKFLARQRVINEGNTLRVAGIFRSSTRETFDVTPEDEDLVRELPPESASIVLIKPFLTGNSIFRIFRKTEDGWQQFEEYEVRSEVRAQAAPGPAPTPVQNDSPVPQQPITVNPLSAETAVNQIRRGNSLFTWANTLSFCGIFVFLGALFAAAYGLRKAPQSKAVPAPVQDLGLRAVSEGETVRLNWNRDVPSVRDASAGHLRIDDGGHSREVVLDIAQLSHGSISFTPATDDVMFHLDIQAKGRPPSSEVARILINRRQSDVAAPVVQPKSLPIPVSKRLPALNRAASRRSASTMKPPRVQPRAMPNRVAIAPERVPGGVPATPQAALPMKDVVPQVISKAEPPETLEPPAPRPPVPTPDLPVPARAVKKILPLLSHTSSAPVVMSAMTITVEVSIDRLGNVVSAHAGLGRSQYWAGKAVEAAKQWKFQPALLHGQPVPSLSTIDFRFAPTAR